MAKRIEEYVKYTQSELDSYVSTPASCVHKINSNRHYALDPYVLSDLRKSLPAYILKNEISYYEPKLQGVLLSLKNIKVLNGVAALRADDPHLHINVNADSYVFRPEVGAELTGVVKYIGKPYVGVILYRVFNAKINFQQRINKDQLTIGQDLKFRVRKFDLNGMFFNIHGELLTSPTIESTPTATKKSKRIVFAEEEDNGTPDSGIEEENKLIELNELLNSIKNEPLSEDETPKQKSKPTKRKLKKINSAPSTEGNELQHSGKKRMRKSSDSTSLPSVVVKTEFDKKIKKEEKD